jgi:hypothetical protein
MREDACLQACGGNPGFGFTWLDNQSPGINKGTRVHSMESKNKENLKNNGILSKNNKWIQINQPTRCSNFSGLLLVA